MITPSSNKSINILLAFDGSEHAFAAIDLLRNLPLTSDSNILILGVLVPRESSNHAILEASLQKAEDLLLSSGFQVQKEMVLGYPAEMIMQFANQNKVDLIAMGAKGLRHTLGILLGGVAQQIIEYSEQPVLVVRSPLQKLHRVLFVTDGSISSQKTISYLTGEERPGMETKCKRFPFPPDITFYIMHVLPPFVSPELLAGSWPIGPDILPPFSFDQESEMTRKKEEDAKGHELLDQTAEIFRKCLDYRIQIVLKRGDAATEIIEFIKDNQIDLVIAGSRGLSEIRAWLLGSVSRKLVHYAPCSVLVVK